MSDRVDGEALGRSLVHAVTVHPKMASRVRNGRWVEGPAPAPTELEDLPGCCDAFVDAPFDPEGGAPVRVAFDGKHILVACLHAATDANGLVGFCRTFLRQLAGIPESITPVHAGPVLANRSAWTPATFRELRRLRAPTLRRPTPFPASGDPVGESESFTWALSSEESSHLAVRARASGELRPVWDISYNPVTTLVTGCVVWRRRQEIPRSPTNILTSRRGSSVGRAHD